MSARDRAHGRPGHRGRARFSLRAWLVLLAAGLGVSIAGCGGGRPRSAAPASAHAAPADGDPARVEIARLWDEIEAAGHGRWRGQTGVAESLAATPEREAAGAGAPVSIDHAPEAAAGADSGRVSVPASPDATCPAAASELPACRDSCTLAASICDNAGRICRLAQQLPGDDWAAGKCEDATEVCRQATADCCDCRAGA